MHHALRAFRHPNYRLFFCGQSVSLIGTWIQQIAISWLVYRLSGSALLLGITGFAGQIAILLFAPFGGIWADRFDRRKLLIVAQWLAAMLSLALAALLWSGVMNVWYAVAFAALLGMVMAVETPVRASFTPELVPSKADLPSAIAFGGGMQNAGRMIGPTIAGLLLVWFSESFCFALNAASKLAVIASLMLIRVTPQPKSDRSINAWTAVREGARYAWSLAPLRYLLPMLALMSFTITPYHALMPIFAAEIFAGGAETLGYLIGAAGFGGLIGMAYLAARPHVRGLARWVAIASGLAGAALTAFTFSRSFALSLALMTIVGFGVIITAMAVNTIIQTVCDTDKRGRVMSYYTMAFLGMHPLGCLAAGALASWIGAPHALALFGAVCIIGAAALLRRMPLLRAQLRPMYVELGIIEK